MDSQSAISFLEALIEKKELSEDFISRAYSLYPKYFSHKSIEKITYHMLIADKLDMAVVWFNRIPQNRQLLLQISTRLIGVDDEFIIQNYKTCGLFSKADIPLILTNELIEIGLKDASCIEVLLNEHFKEKNMRKADKLVNHAIKLCSKNEFSKPEIRRIINIILHGFAEMGNQNRQAYFSLLNLLEKVQAKPDCDTFIALLEFARISRNKGLFYELYNSALSNIESPGNRFFIFALLTLTDLGAKIGEIDKIFNDYMKIRSRLELEIVGAFCYAYKRFQAIDKQYELLEKALENPLVTHSANGSHLQYMLSPQANIPLCLFLDTCLDNNDVSYLQLEPKIINLVQAYLDKGIYIDRFAWKKLRYFFSNVCNIEQYLKFVYIALEQPILEHEKNYEMIRRPGYYPGILKAKTIDLPPMKLFNPILRFHIEGIVHVLRIESQHLLEGFLANIESKGIQLQAIWKRNKT